ncbi:MAG TPA: glycosyltransferase family 2 protein [Rhizomicrobium sp.]|jgi:hypothetical protein|nr:glycosyltransferase family 2 protein [Rhizomicrobium sp.]
MAANRSHVDAAIVTTLRNVGAPLDSFIAWHLNCGFSRLFLFFDDPADPDLPRAAAHPAITVIPHDAALRRAWTHLPEYRHYGDFIDREVMARQVLNSVVAMEIARSQGLAWLVHIDADELFHSPEQACAAHFAWADTQKVDTIKYLNYEAVPEKIEIQDPFREVDLFKIPPALKPGPASDAGRKLLDATPQLQPNRFHFYSNGKSAVRLAAPGMRPRSVHTFDNPLAPAQPLLCSMPSILHYACCGFENFWDKYRRLGGFTDKWFGRKDIRGAIGPLHLDARDAVAGGDRASALEFYRRRIAIEDSGRCEELIRHGVLTRFPQPRHTLGRLAATAAAP